MSNSQQNSVVPASKPGGGEEVVRVNVGGTLYTTYRSTLTRYPDSVLAKLFTNPPAAAAPPRDPSGAYILDRDGAAFRHVLNFLRNPQQLVLPDAAGELEALRVEADYYQLGALLRDMGRLQDLVRHIHVLAQASHIIVSGRVDIPELAEIKRSWSLLNQGQSIHDPNYTLYECSKERGAQQLAPYCTLLMEKKQPQQSVSGGGSTPRIITENEKEWLMDLLKNKGWRVVSRAVASINGSVCQDFTLEKRLPLVL